MNAFMLLAICGINFHVNRHNPPYLGLFVHPSYTHCLTNDLLNSEVRWLTVSRHCYIGSLLYIVIAATFNPELFSDYLHLPTLSGAEKLTRLPFKVG
jgi:hypothetical protein